MNLLLSLFPHASAQGLSSVAQVQQTGTLINAINTNIVSAIGVLLLALTVIAFFAGMVRFIWAIRQGEEKKATEGKRFMLWSLLAVFVVFSIYGIIIFMQMTLLGKRAETTIGKPCLNFISGCSGTTTEQPTGTPSSGSGGGVTQEPSNTGTTQNQGFGTGNTGNTNKTDSTTVVVKSCASFVSSPCTMANGSAGTFACLANATEPVCISNNGSANPENICTAVLRGSYKPIAYCTLPAYGTIDLLSKSAEVDDAVSFVSGCYNVVFGTMNGKTCVTKYGNVTTVKEMEGVVYAIVCTNKGGIVKDDTCIGQNGQEVSLVDKEMCQAQNGVWNQTTGECDVFGHPSAIDAEDVVVPDGAEFNTDAVIN